MAVAFDQYSVKNNASNTLTTGNLSFTLGASADTLVACLELATSDGVTNPTSIAITWNGVSMTQIAGMTNTAGNGGSACLYGFGITKAQMGATAFTGTHNLVASWASITSASVVGAASFIGGDQTGGTTTFINATTTGSTSATQLTKSVVTANGNATVAMWVYGSGVGTSNGSPAHDWLDISSIQSTGQHRLSTTTSDSFTSDTGPATDNMQGTFVCVNAAAAGAAVEGAGTPTTIYRVIRPGWRWKRLPNDRRKIFVARRGLIVPTRRLLRAA